MRIGFVHGADFGNTVAALSRRGMTVRVIEPDVPGAALPRQIKADEHRVLVAAGPPA